MNLYAKYYEYLINKQCRFMATAGWVRLVRYEAKMLKITFSSGHIFTTLSDLGGCLMFILHVPLVIET